jgi:hypothetical protein
MKHMLRGSVSAVKTTGPSIYYSLFLLLLQEHKFCLLYTFGERSGEVSLTQIILSKAGLFTAVTLRYLKGVNLSYNYNYYVYVVVVLLLSSSASILAFVICPVLKQNQFWNIVSQTFGRILIVSPQPNIPSKLTKTQNRLLLHKLIAAKLEDKFLVFYVTEGSL